MSLGTSLGQGLLLIYGETSSLRCSFWSPYWWRWWAAITAGSERRRKRSPPGCYPAQATRKAHLWGKVPLPQNRSTEALPMDHMPQHLAAGSRDPGAVYLPMCSGLFNHRSRWVVDHLPSVSKVCELDGAHWLELLSRHRLWRCFLLSLRSTCLRNLQIRGADTDSGCGG